MSTAATGVQSPSFLSRRTAVLVFLAFAFAYFFSALLRAITATLSPTLSQEFSLHARDLGLLAGGYFLGFAATQLPLMHTVPDAQSAAREHAGPPSVPPSSVVDELHATDATTARSASGRHRDIGLFLTLKTTVAKPERRRKRFRTADLGNPSVS